MSKNHEFSGKAELRRKKRGVHFPGMGDGWRSVCQLREYRGGVLAYVVDGSWWRLYMRGGKTFRRRLKRGRPGSWAFPETRDSKSAWVINSQSIFPINRQYLETVVIAFK